MYCGISLISGVSCLGFDRGNYGTAFRLTLIGIMGREFCVQSSIRLLFTLSIPNFITIPSFPSSLAPSYHCTF